MSQQNSYLKKIWGEILEQLKTDIDDVVFETYFLKSEIYDITKNNKIRIKVPTNLEKMVLEKFKTTIEDKSNYVLEGNYQAEIYNEDELDVYEEVDDSRSNMKLQLELDLYDNILPQFTFENFVVGESNKESHSASLASALSPGAFYNPLFIYGNSGLGKTHLLHAMGNYVKANDPKLKVLYITSTDFITKVINSFKNNTTEDLKQDMYKLDLLLMDDIQFFAGDKVKTHEIFFHIFNELVNNRKQIVITSDKHPTEIKGIEERLISRFYSGLSVSLDSPEFEVAYAILVKKLEQQMFDPENIDDEVIAYLATHFAKDVRKLEGALNRLVFYSINFGKSERITMDVATKAFKNEMKSVNDIISLDSIKEIVATYYGLTVKQIDSKNRTRIIVNARHISMYLVRKHLDLPYSQIGNEFGGRDHSTVISAYDKIEDLLKSDNGYKVAIAEIEKKFLTN